MSTKTTTKKAAATKAANESTINKAGAVNIDTALAGLTAAQTKISRTLADIQEELIAKHSELAAVDEAINLKKQEMTALHGADQILLGIDELHVRLNEEITQAEKQREELAEQYEQLSQDAQVARQREEAEYKYKRDQERKIDADRWNQEKAARKNDEAIRIAAFERDLLERTAVMAKAEQDLIARTTEVDGRVEATRKELERNAAIELNSVKKHFEHTAAMAAVEQKAIVTALTKDVAHRDGMIQTKDAIIASLESQLREAMASQTKLAQATVEAAGNKTAQAEALSLVASVQAGGNGATRPRG